MVDPKRRSRGLLVRDALQGSSTARELHQRLTDLRGDLHNGFHLVYSDLRESFCTWGDGARIVQTDTACDAPDRQYLILKNGDRISPPPLE